jgi:hypothetical protein
MRQQVHDPLVGDETDHLVESKAWAPGIAKTAYTAVAPAEQQPLALPGEGGTAALVKRLAHRLLDLQRAINDIDKTITERFRDHPYARIIESLPDSALTWVRSSWSSPAVISPPSLAQDDWPLRRIGSYAKGLRPCRRKPAPTQTLQPPTTPGVYMAALSSIRADGPSRQKFYTANAASDSSIPRRS